MNIQRFHKILEIGLEKKASDLHIVVDYPPILRINTDLVALEKEGIITSQESRELAFYLLGEERKEKFLKEKELDFGYSLSDMTRFRVNTYFTKGEITIALRFISQKIRTIKELNLPSVLERVTEANQGFFLVTGASSQGKSTTLAALIDRINHARKVHIITIEDPIEYIFRPDKSLINQREVYKDTLSFSKALRSTLREDPDVIMVGEMRDLETISTAVTAAETGHLVFATLHTNSASQTIHRIIDIFPSHQQNQIRAQLSSSLLGVISQRLIMGLERQIIPACEIMFNTPAVANLIRENKIHELPTIIEISKDMGMNSFNASLAELVKREIIDKETALKYSFNPKDLMNRL